MRSERRVGNHLRQGHGRYDDHGRQVSVPARLLPVHERVQRRHPQAHQVGGRGQMRFVGHAPRGVETHRTGHEPGPELGGQVAGGAIVGRDYQGGMPDAQRVGEPVEHPGQEEAAQRSRHEGLPAGAGQLDRRLVLRQMPEQGTQRVGPPPRGSRACEPGSRPPERGSRLERTWVGPYQSL